MNEPTPPNTLFGFFQNSELAWVLLAMAGGVARYLDSYLKGSAIPKWGMMLGHALVSGFSGYMVAQVALKFQPDWALICAGVGGYLGTQGLDLLAEVVRRRLGVGHRDHSGDK